MASVVLLGTLDTKGEEYAFLRGEVEAAGCQVVLVDAGVTGDAAVEVTADRVAAAAGADRAALSATGDRALAIETMARGAATVVQALHAEGRLDGILGLGGSNGTSILATAMQALPIGVPKLIVSTMAAGDTRPYVGTSDITLMYPVVDIAGLNRLSRQVLANAAAGIAGMARAGRARPAAPGGRPVVGATMFGVTMGGVTSARERLEALGYEVLVFHATGSGGRSMEALVRAGFITAVLDATTTELVDELVGGTLSAGPSRLEAAGDMGLPQVVSLGALDMCNFGPPETVPARFRDRVLHAHNAAVTLMRTSEAESAELGRRIAAKLNRATGPTSVLVPLRGFSRIATEGGPFHDPAADAALVRELRAGLRAGIDVVELDTDINDPAFGLAMAERLHASCLAAGVAPGTAWPGEGAGGAEPAAKAAAAGTGTP